jgi:hypothetical protein
MNASEEVVFWERALQVPNQSTESLEKSRAEWREAHYRLYHNRWEHHLVLSIPDNHQIATPQLALTLNR